MHIITCFLLVFIALLATSRIAPAQQGQPRLLFPWDGSENPWVQTDRPHDWRRTGAGPQSGLDFGKSGNTSRRVLSMFDGAVTKVLRDDPSDTCNNSVLKVAATDDSGWELWYLHLSEFTVSEGTPVLTGDLLGYSGNIGCAKKVHLHVELLINGVRSTWLGKTVNGWPVNNQTQQPLTSSNDTNPPIHALQNYTIDHNLQPKTSFARGATIGYAIGVRNTRNTPATATIRFRAQGPCCGSQTQEIFFWIEEDLRVPPGLARYYSPSTIPLSAPPGVYFLDVVIRYTGPEIDGPSTLIFGASEAQFTVRNDILLLGTRQSNGSRNLTSLPSR